MKVPEFRFMAKQPTDPAWVFAHLQGRLRKRIIEISTINLKEQIKVEIWGPTCCCLFNHCSSVNLLGAEDKAADMSWDESVKHVEHLDKAKPWVCLLPLQVVLLNRYATRCRIPLHVRQAMHRYSSAMLKMRLDNMDILLTEIEVPPITAHKEAPDKEDGLNIRNKGKDQTLMDNGDESTDAESEDVNDSAEDEDDINDESDVNDDVHVSINPEDSWDKDIGEHGIAEESDSESLA